MNGSYSKIKEVNSSRSKSIDFSDLSYFQEPENFQSNKSSKEGQQESSKFQIKKQGIVITTKDNEDVHQGLPKQENDEESVGEIFGVMLSRQRSASAAASFSQKSIISEKQNVSSSVQSIMKRALSLKRSSSVPQGYCRIHHQCEPGADDDAGIVCLNARQTKPRKKKSKILNVCRRIFGF